MDDFSSKIAPRPAPFSEFPSGGFFYASASIADTLATIGSNVQARRSLTVIIGEAGSGKTALLNKIAADLSVNVVLIRASNPRLNFTDVLQLIQGKLNHEIPATAEAELLAICKFQLRALLHQRQIPVLMVDNAHHLAASTVKRLTQSFAAADQQDCGGSVLPVILAGRPQLKTTLLQAPQSLRSERPWIGEIGPLQSFEVVSYVELGLRRANLHPELFDLSAVTQIALSSRGNPARINALCARALQIANGQTNVNITGDLIQAVAKDLETRETQFVEWKPTQERITAAAKNAEFKEFQLGDRDSTEVVGETFVEYSRSYDRDRRLRSRRINSGLSLVASLILLTATAGVWFLGYSLPARLARWSHVLSALWAERRQYTALPKSDVFSETTIHPGPTPREANSTETLSTPQVGESKTSDEVQPEPIAASPGEPPVETAVPHHSEPTAPRGPTHQPKRAPLPADTAQHRENLAAKIIQAISNRAIIGVAVSVDRDTAILEGHVASERQRRAAERAARSVRGIERVRNRITVNLG